MSDAVKNELDDEIHRLDRCASITELMMVEGRIANIYWRYLQQILPERYGFRSRIRRTHQMNAQILPVHGNVRIRAKANE